MFIINLDTTKIFVGDALEALRDMEDESVDCCVTSPPYYRLRDYGVEGQIGLEETPDEFIAKLVEVFREVRRVLKSDGTLWINIADSYAGSNHGRNKDKSGQRGVYTYGQCKESASQKAGVVPRTASSKEYKKKDLIGIPWMLAFALRADGWYLRQDIIWEKPNCMPESVRDRCTKSHEYIFLLSKSEKYYFDAEAIKEPAVGFDNSTPRGSNGVLGKQNAGRRKGNAKTFRGGGAYTNNRSFHNSTEVERSSTGNVENETGLRNKRDVWHVATQGYAQVHFATFPEKLITPCILAGCRENGIVLDPFAGSGTTSVVAERNGRRSIGIELNPEYAAAAANRVMKARPDDDEK